ncbi:molybdopterin converting factor subunit 1 [Evansella tamaricis]|uniref:Molybdopterin synthase sulfur carrier subunit n=1 Tax=Evansella tamaricis TaxID=2069301 RepID=A0ABS6JCV1_9BACI|nr:molybdopterin converting factor subunit 1 [Evansella tamaricis]MBU9711493.1 molybdopterin converting factor subunit 1 [Evansella tamaricis]
MIKILLFADLEEKAGQREIDIDSTAMKVGDIRKYLVEKYPQLTAIKSALPAINEEYAQDDVEAKSGDIVAFIPPVSGG